MQRIKRMFSKITLFTVFAAMNSLSPQQHFWQQTNGPYGGMVLSLVVNPRGDIFLGTEMNIYRSTNNGDDWSRLNTRSGDYNPDSFKALAINSKGHLFAGTMSYDGVYCSTNNGDTWFPINTGLDSIDFVNCMAINQEDHIFIGTYRGIFRSTNNGADWTHIDNLSVRVETIAMNSFGDIFIGTYREGIFRSKDNGGTWEAKNTGFPADLANLVLSMAVNKQDHIFIGCDKGIYRSTDNGEKWNLVNNELTRVFSITADSGTIFAGTNAVYRSTDNGDSWAKVSEVLSVTNRIYALACNLRGDIFAGYGRFDAGIYRSTNNGDTWREINAGITDIVIRDFIFNTPGSIFALGETHHSIFRFINDGEYWQSVNSGLASQSVYALACNSKRYLFAGTWPGSLFRSTNNGESWHISRNGLGTAMISALAVNLKDYIFACGPRTVFRSIDDGTNWFPIKDFANDSPACIAFNSHDHIFLGITWGRIFRSTDDGESWSEITEFSAPSQNEILSIAVNSKDDIFVAVKRIGIYRSNDHGKNWSCILDAKDADHLPIAINSIGHIYVCAGAKGVFRSVDNGETWHEVNAGLPEKNIYSLAFTPSGILYAGTIGAGVFRSTESTTFVEQTFEMPVSVSLEQNFPNPFNVTTTIPFSLPNSSFTTLKIYNTMGAEIVTLISEKVEKGVHSIKWNANNVASGIYYYRLCFDDIFAAKKLILLK